MTADTRRLRIPSSMSLEQAMAEVRRYLEMRNSANTAMDAEIRQGGPATVRPSQFVMQAELIGRLSEIAGRLDQVEADSKLGPPGVFLKRMLRKAIGWYSRPAQQFDRTALELLHQIRHDMLLLQQQIMALQQQPSGHAFESVPGEDSEVFLLMIELFKNTFALQAFRQALRDENPELLKRYEALLDKADQETRDLKGALLQQLQARK